MTIKETFPFDLCERCPDCILDVYEHVLTANGAVQTREITVGCKNGSLCTRMHSRIHKEYEQEKSRNRNPNCMGLGYDACETCEYSCPYR